MLLQIKIKEETIKKTNKCNKKFACLSTNNQVCCKVEYRTNGSFLFIYCSNNKHCNYIMTLGNNYICNCPIRKEIYNRYCI